MTGNVNNRYNDKDDIIGTKEEGDREMGDIIADITTSFVVLAGIFFPSVTGIGILCNLSFFLWSAFCFLFYIQDM